jgi:DNA-binding winged helix-turn-helix (wHTH) protein/tetratricopeptide (TPR) repeat protein
MAVVGYTTPSHRMPAPTYSFGTFRLDTGAYELRRGAQALDVPPKVIDLLALLILNRPSLVTKDAILAGLWPDVAVTDNAITQVVSELRQALGDDAGAPMYVQTVPRRGYRFIAEVQESAAITREPAADEPKKRRTIAVSDFQNVNEDPDVAWLGSGIAETLTNDLRALRELSVIDRLGLPELTRRAGLAAGRSGSIDWIVVGSYQRAGERLRITARVLDVKSGEAVAQARADGPVSDAFQVQDTLVRQLLADLQVPVSDAAAARIGARETSSIEAYRAMTEGRLKLESLDLSVIPEAIRDFDRALTLDPRYALAYAGLADAHFWLYEASRARNKPDHDELRLAIGHARRAVALDPGLGDAHASLALFLMAEGESHEAVECGRRAVALEPNDWRHLFRLGVAAWGTERLTCLAEVERLYPEFAHSYFSAAMVHVARGDFGDAERVLQRGLDRCDTGRTGPLRFPGSGLHWLLGLIKWVHRGDQAGAREQFERELTSGGGFLYAAEYSRNGLDSLGFLALDRGDPAEADAMFTRALNAYPDHARSLIGLAMACRATGERDRAEVLMDHADQAIRELQLSNRPREAATARACWQVASGAGDAACETLLAMIDSAPPGTTGWNLPLEPWLAPIRDMPQCRRVFTRLAERAR